jgi:DNA polymerase III gamma/tau subunit
MPLHIDYRPQTVDEVFGNEDIVDAIKGILKDDTRSHAYAFYGNSGCGKTTLARVMVAALDGRGSDVIEVNAAETRGIDMIRELSRRLYYRPVEGSIRACILDEVSNLTKDACNALLKILEDCPGHTYFFLCSTEPDKIMNTIRNRCTTFVVSKLSKNHMKEMLMLIMESEKIKIKDDVLENLIKRANGVPRTALVLLDQVKDIKGEVDFNKLIVEDVEEVTVPMICKILLEETDSKKAWEKLRRNLKQALSSSDAERIRRGIVGYLAKRLQDSDLIYAHFVGSMIKCFSEPAYEEGILWMQVCLACGGDE